MKTIMLTAVVLLCGFITITGCAAVEHDLEVLAADPNVIQSVESLVHAAGLQLDRAIGIAQDNAIRVVAVDPNGTASDLHAATELKAVKSQLDNLTKSTPDKVIRFVQPAP